MINDTIRNRTEKTSESTKPGKVNRLIFFEFNQKMIFNFLRKNELRSKLNFLKTTL